MDMIQLSRKEPFVILLDLDHTIQGNIQPQLEEFHLIQYINTKILHNTKTTLKQSKDHLIRDFMKGVLRYHFKGFISRMRSRFPNVEFFVYTASEDSWAKYIVKVIESVINIRLNKRIFSRSDCVLNQSNGLTKSVNKLKPELFKILKSKYKLKSNFEFKHIFLIDNNYVLNENENHMLIKCPNYTTTINIDLTRSVPIDVIRNNLKDISMYIFGYYENNLNIFFKKIHTKSLNIKLTKDTFWESQLKTFKRNYEVI
jgi:hypothetical protein